MALDLTIPLNCTSFKTKQFSRFLTRLYDVEIAASGLKISQYSLLTHILNRGPLTLGDLALRMGLTLSTLSRNLKPLEDHGWVDRAAGADSRTRVVVVTAAGKVKQAQAHKFWQIGQRNINAKIGIERVLALHALIDECTKILRAELAEVG